MLVPFDQSNSFHQGFIKAKNYPSSTSVEVMTEGGESAMFKHLFKSWRDKDQTQGLGTTYSTGKIGNLCYDLLLRHSVGLKKDMWW